MAHLAAVSHQEEMGTQAIIDFRYHGIQIHTVQAKPSQENPNRYIAPHDEMEVLGFPALAGEALKSLLVVAIVSTEENQRSDALIRFGAIWFYCEYGNLAWCGNVITDFDKAFSIDSQNPFDVVVEETYHYKVGKPSEDFFPFVIRNIISEEIKSVYPTATPDFSLFFKTPINFRTK